MSDFFAMGGYAAYVWPAYGASVLVLAGMALYVWRRGRALKVRLLKLDASAEPKAEDRDA